MLYLGFVQWSKSMHYGSTWCWAKFKCNNHSIIFFLMCDIEFDNQQKKNYMLFHVISIYLFIYLFISYFGGTGRESLSIRMSNKIYLGHFLFPAGFCLVWVNLILVTPIAETMKLCFYALGDNIVNKEKILCLSLSGTQIPVTCIVYQIYTAGISKHHVLLR